MDGFLIATGIVALAEVGDKTQVATIALAAQYNAFFAVIAGTTLGMMIANVPAVLLGDRITNRVPIRLVHSVAAAMQTIAMLVRLSSSYVSDAAASN